MVKLSVVKRSLTFLIILLSTSVLVASPLLPHIWYTKQRNIMKPNREPSKALVYDQAKATETSSMSVFPIYVGGGVYWY